MKKTVRGSTRMKPPNPVFHFRNKKEDESVMSVPLLKQARNSGKLNLSNKQLVNVPEEVLKLGDVHSEDNNVNLDDNYKGNDGNRWWELQPLNYLDMSSNCLTNIPNQINQLDSLTVLLLQDNNLSSVPVELGHLLKLSKLDLAHNKLSSLPLELAGCKELRTLNVSHNMLTSVPECVYDLVMLERLDLSHNKMSKMSPGMGFLCRMSHLTLSHNQLVNIPPDLSNCRGLIELDLSFNSITTSGLPALSDLHNVQVIHLHNNCLSLLPEIHGCSNLKEIHLANNKMTLLVPEDAEPEITIEQLSTLSHLQIINLRDNKIEKLPREMSCMQNLVRLDLTNNELKELPGTLGLLPHLNNLLVEGNSLRTIRRDIISGGTQRLLKHLKQTMPVTDDDKALLTKLPGNVDTLPDRFTMRSSKCLNLAAQSRTTIPEQVFEEAVNVPCNMVDLSKNMLQVVPSGVWSLEKHLTDLNLSQNALKELPVDVGRCVNLTYLNLARNQVRTLPAELALCLRLREVNIAANKFSEIPGCLYNITGLEILLAQDNIVNVLDATGLSNLKKLATLDLSNNSISAVPPQLGNMTQIRSLGLDGNGLRAPRPAILAKGTDAILSWLRDKIVT